MQSKMADDPVAETEQEEIAEAKEDNDSSGRGARWLNFKIEKQNLRYKVEALLRARFLYVCGGNFSRYIWHRCRGTCIDGTDSTVSYYFACLYFPYVGVYSVRTSPGDYWLLFHSFGVHYSPTCCCHRVK